MSTHSLTFIPLVCSVISDALLKAMPAIPQWRIQTFRLGGTKAEDRGAEGAEGGRASGGGYAEA